MSRAKSVAPDPTAGMHVQADQSVFCNLKKKKKNFIIQKTKWSMSIQLQKHMLEKTGYVTCIYIKYVYNE